MLAMLLAAGLLMSGCGTEQKNTVETDAQTVETVTETPTPQTEDAQGDDREDPQDDEIIVELPQKEELVADYTTVEGLTLEKATCFGVVVKSTETGYWKAVRKGISKAVDDLNLMLGYTGEDKITFTFEGMKDQTDVDGQVNTLEAVLTEATLSGKPYVICLAAIDMNSCEALLEGAQGSGIPVIVLDSGVTSDLVQTSCVTDNYAAGREAALRLCQQIGDAGQVAVAAHMKQSASSKDRVRGFTDEIAENHPQVSVVRVSYETEEESGIEEEMEEVLSTYTDLKGYFATSETISEQVLAVLEKMPEREIRMVGFDMGEKQIQAIREGRQAGTIAQNPYGMGYATIVAGARSLLGMENDDVINPGYQWIDQENIDLEENEKYIYQ